MAQVVKRGRHPTATSNPSTADAPNVMWVDFQLDAATEGRPIKIASIVDEHTRECLGGPVERNVTGRHLIDERDGIAVDRGYPAVLRCENGPSSLTRRLTRCGHTTFPRTLSRLSGAHAGQTLGQPEAGEDGWNAKRSDPTDEILAQFENVERER
jgi:hypothetical protein